MSDFNKGVGTGVGFGAGLIAFIIGGAVLLVVLCCGGCLFMGGLGAITDSGNSTSYTSP